ncbi:MAG: hypothetical protein AAB345_04465 [Patescibacteria group bacterium]
MINTKTKISLLLTTGYLLLAGTAFAAHVSDNIATANIDRHAWNDVVGWIDFGAGEVEVTDTQLKGYANILQAGFLALDCATTPIGAKCAADGGADWGVKNDGTGKLSGWGWNDNLGWISFRCDEAKTNPNLVDCGTGPGEVDYHVDIGSNGDFSGWAWNDVVGWISFNCVNVGPGTCNDPPTTAAKYKVNTDWREPGPSIPPPAGDGPTGIGPGGSGGGGGGGSSFDDGTYLISSIFDTKVQGGAALNTIMWQGVQPSGTAVGIQVASSNSATGPWVYMGPDGTSASAYEANQGVQFRLNPKFHNNQRYFRYKVYLSWTAGDTPEVEDVIVSYSP